jgi:uncharacterized protein YciI
MHILLFYEVGEDYVERRGPFRAEHLGLIQQAHERGELVMAGSRGSSGWRGSVLRPSTEAAVAFAQADPYVKNGLVKVARAALEHCAGDGKDAGTLNAVCVGCRRVSARSVRHSAEVGALVFVSTGVGIPHGARCHRRRSNRGTAAA